MSSTPFKEKLLRTVAPAYIIALGVYQFILTIFDTVLVQHEPYILVQFSNLRDRAFSRFWNAYGAFLSEGMSPEAVGLLHTVGGTVLDLGPGSGDQIVHFDASRITRVYGAEPAQALHDKLRARVCDAGLEGRYSVLHCGAQPESLIPALAKAGVVGGGAEEGVFDEICCIRVLCGVPRPAETMRGLYGLLKPGGRMVVHEHVVNPWREEGNVVSRVLQTVYSWVGWDLFLGCKINRDTKALLLNAGGKDGWSKVELRSLEGWSVLPYCTGYLVKRE